MATGNPVVDAILSGTSNMEVREAMLLGSGLESGWSPTAVGDGGTSFGPFQMHIGGALTAAGGTPAQAENPTWAVQHMLAAYEAGVNSVSQSLWSSNPEQAAEEAAVAAERPAQTYYQSQGVARVNQWWASTQSALSGNPGSAGPPSGGSSGGTGTGSGSTNATLTSFPIDPSLLPFPFNIIGSIGNVFGGNSGNPLANSLGAGLFSAFEAGFGWFLKQFGISSVKDFFIRVGLILLGSILVIEAVGAITRESITTGIGEVNRIESGEKPEKKEAATQTAPPKIETKTSSAPKQPEVRTGAGQAVKAGSSGAKAGGTALAAEIPKVPVA